MANRNMIRNIQIFLGFILSIVLVVPISFTSRHWYISALVALISSSLYIYNYLRSKKILIAFLASVLFGIFFSVAFWGLYYINRILLLDYKLYFLGAFLVAFILIALIIASLKEASFKNVTLLLLNGITIAAFVLLLIYGKSSRDTIGQAIIFGALIGFVIGSIIIYGFRYFIGHSSEIFSGLTDYIAILIKPFLIFFIGYVMLAFLYAGIYNLIYECSPLSLSLPERQIHFLDLLIYSLDTMTTGGNSAVNAHSTLVQAVNTANVLTAIIWMTVMLAATIAYTSEFFSEISKRHKGNSSGAEVNPSTSQ